MSAPRISAADVTGFAEAIEREFGHQPDERRTADLERLLVTRMEATGNRTFASYRLGLLPGSPEWERLAPLLTVPETYFFRMPGHFEALAEEALPKLIRANRTLRTLRLLSAGCASGEEAYTLRIVLEERFPELADWRVEIVGIDLSEAALERARAGLYSEWSLRATSPARRLLHFTAAGKQFRLNPEARAGVSFRRGNLLSAPRPGDPPFDVVFCRNVLIYFSEAASQAVVVHLAERLRPGGYLFLGPAESLRGISREFTLCQAHETFFYRRRERTDLALYRNLRSFAKPRVSQSPVPPLFFGPAATPRSVSPEPPRASLLPSTAASSTTWFDTIRNSSERLASLVLPVPPEPGFRDSAKRVAGQRQAGRRRVPPPAADRPPGGEPARIAPPSPEQPARQAHELHRGGDHGHAQGGTEWTDGAVALFRQERFAEALALLDQSTLAGLSGEGAYNDAVQSGAERARVSVLRAVLLVNLGRFSEAEAACRAALSAESSNPGAYFLLGLCAEQAGRLPEAEQHMSAAVSLDPGFSMAYLHLGMVARRQGETGAAQAALGKALQAIDNEGGERLLLFGGGFSRGSLREICLREQARTEQPRTEQPRTEQARTEQPRTEQPRTEQPRTEQPGAGQPRTGAS